MGVAPRSPKETTPFLHYGRRLNLAKRGDLGDRRDAIFETMVPLSKLRELWRQIGCGALSTLVREAVEKLLTDKALGKGQEDIVVKMKHDKTRVPLRPVELRYVQRSQRNTEFGVGGYREEPAARALSYTWAFPRRSSRATSSLTRAWRPQMRPFVWRCRRRLTSQRWLHLPATPMAAEGWRASCPA